METQTVERIEQPLAVYDPFMVQLAEFKKENALMVFEYEDTKGNKAARSYVHKLRQSKAAVESARKSAKAEHLETGRKIDAKAKEITTELQEMIDVHKDELDKIEQRETDRIKDIKDAIDNIAALALADAVDLAQMRNNLSLVKDTKIDDSFAEFANDAATTKDLAVTTLESAIAKAVAHEAEQAELSRLREEAAQRERDDREAEIAAKAKADAEREAKQREAGLKAKAEADKQDAKDAAEVAKLEVKQREVVAKEKAERAKLKLKLEKEKAEKARAEAEKRELELKAQNERLEREAAERAEQIKAAQGAVTELRDAINSASGETIELKLSTATTLLLVIEDGAVKS